MTTLGGQHSSRIGGPTSTRAPPSRRTRFAGPNPGPGFLRGWQNGFSNRVLQHHSTKVLPRPTIFHCLQAKEFDDATASEIIERDFALGIEFEFFLTQHVFNDTFHTREKDLWTFAWNLKRTYTTDILDGRLPLPPATNFMLNLVEGFPGRPYDNEQNRYDYWCLEREFSLEELRTNATEPPWGIELISPVLWPSTWRAKVAIVWKWLTENYVIAGDRRCATHIHMSRRDRYTVDDVRRIAQAAIWWEPAWEAILPGTRRGNYHCKSIYMDNRKLARSGLTRELAIDRLERCTTIDQIIDLVHPEDTKTWGVNFTNLKLGAALRTIEFRRFPHCETIEEVNTYVDTATAFFHAAMQVSGREAFTDAKNRTVRGLEQFLLGAKGPFVRSDIARLFDEKRNAPTLRPLLFLPMNMNPVEEQRIRNITEAVTMDDTPPIY